MEKKKPSIYLIPSLLTLWNSHLQNMVDQTGILNISYNLCKTIYLYLYLLALTLLYNASFQLLHLTVMTHKGSTLASGVMHSVNLE